MAAPPEHDPYPAYYRPGEDVIDKVPGHMNRARDLERPPELQAAEAQWEMARAMWAIAWVLDDLAADAIDGP